MSFSIVIPLYNKELYIAQSISSVLEQTYQNFELIIVDDGSTDNSVKEAEKFVDKRIRLISQKNSGVSAARNSGIKESKYDLIAFLDADDRWENDFLGTMISLKEKFQNCSVFAVNYQIMSHDKKFHLPIVNGLPSSFKDGVLKNYFQIASQSDPILCSSSIAIKKQAIEAISGFPIGVRAGEDLLTWARLAAHFDIAYTIQPKAVFCRWNTAEDNNPRIPDSHDNVANALRALLTDGDKNKIDGIKRYIAYWHKIRVALFLRLEMYNEAKNEFKKMSAFAEKDFKFFIYTFLVYLPPSMKKRTLKIINFFNNIKRNFLKSNKG